MALNSLLDIIRKAQQKHSAFSARMSEAEALGRWELAVGAVIAKHSRAIRVQNAILWVEVDHPVWKSELHYRKQQILDILNGKTPSAHSKLPQAKEILQDIFFVDSKGKSSHPASTK
jgi:predicted nucleic acid-binding Zn ribbon protein